MLFTPQCEAIMPLRFTTTAGGTGYADIRVGHVDQHQTIIDVSALTGAVDADGYLPPGLPLDATGGPVGNAEDAAAILGPEPVKLGSADHFGNAIIGGPVNRDMIEDNLGRALTADELAGIASGMPSLVLV